MMDIGMLIACLVAVTIMIQVLSTEIGNRMNEYAVLKAMGFGPLFIYAIGLTQAAILGIAGLIPALVVAALVLHFIQSATHLGAQLGPQLAGMALLVALGTGLVAASAVMWRVGRADPAELY
jgi:putative ABC transport system permease protein